MLLCSWKQEAVLPHPRGISLPLLRKRASPGSLLGMLHVDRQLDEHMVTQPKPGFSSDLQRPGWVPTIREMLLLQSHCQLLFWGKNPQEYVTVVPLMKSINPWWNREILSQHIHCTYSYFLNTCPWTYVQQLLQRQFFLCRGLPCVLKLWSSQRSFLLLPGWGVTQLWTHYRLTSHCWICAVQPTHLLKPVVWQLIISKASLIAGKVNQNMAENIPSSFLLPNCFVWRNSDMLKGWFSCAAEK